MLRENESVQDFAILFASLRIDRTERAEKELPNYLQSREDVIP
jgi:hypothetical protein